MSNDVVSLWDVILYFIHFKKNPNFSYLRFPISFSTLMETRISFCHDEFLKGPLSSYTAASLVIFLHQQFRLLLTEIDFLHLWHVAFQSVSSASLPSSISTAQNVNTLACKVSEIICFWIINTKRLCEEIVILCEANTDLCATGIEAPS